MKLLNTQKNLGLSRLLHLLRNPFLASHKHRLHLHCHIRNVICIAMQGVVVVFHLLQNLLFQVWITTFLLWNPCRSLQTRTSLAQAGEELLLIDQHALHERIRYERLRNDESLWTPQPRLVPSRIELTLAQQARLESFLGAFRRAWFLARKATRWSMGCDASTSFAGWR